MLMFGIQSCILILILRRFVGRLVSSSLGGTFRFSCWFVGGQNLGPDSCSGWIPVESRHNIPDVPPFLRAGTLLP
jgi:hypothetical protein